MTYEPRTGAPDPASGPRVYATPRIYRPFSRMIRVGRGKPRPARSIGIAGVTIGFALLIIIGTALLSLPAAHVAGVKISLMDALFTATSAVCVVGLVVKDTHDSWSEFGQGVILALIQLGGLGIMSAATLILMILGRPISLRDRLEMLEFSRSGGVRTVKGLLGATILITVIFEAVGAVIIALLLRHYYHAPGTEWSALFHAVSAFNNAGFDLNGNLASLTVWAHYPLLLATIAVLVIAGGISMLVLLDIATKPKWRMLSPNTKIVIITTFLLLAGGAIGLFVAEMSDPVALQGLSLGDKVSNAIFHSVVTRSVGFNSLPVGEMHDRSLFLSMALMFIGGATGSTAGGIKVTTFAVLVLATIASVKGQESATFAGRRLSHRLVYRAMAIVTLSGLAVFIVTLLLTFTEPFAFRQLLFEAVSAFATVGLSTGITPELSAVGKLALVAAMFIGRLGPLTLAYFLAQGGRAPRYQLPEKDIAIG